jgi:hypothetical protein
MAAFIRVMVEDKIVAYLVTLLDFPAIQGNYNGEAHWDVVQLDIPTEIEVEAFES